jgi:hypothetical protein
MTLASMYKEREWHGPEMRKEVWPETLEGRHHLEVPCFKKLYNQVFSFHHQHTSRFGIKVRLSNTGTENLVFFNAYAH